MRLLRLCAVEYGGLHDLNLEFNPSVSFVPQVSLRFFVGPNGSGKTSALALLAHIFSHLAADTQPELDFEIEYELGERQFKVTNRAQGGASLSTAPIQAAIYSRGSDKEQWQPQQWRAGGEGWLPSWVVGCASSPTTRLNREFISAPVAHHPNPAFSHTTLCGPQDGLLAVLALLVHEGEKGTAHHRQRRQVLAQVGLDPHRPLAAFSLHISRAQYEAQTSTQQAHLKEVLSQANVLVPVTDVPSADGDFYATFDVDEGFATKTRQIGSSPATFLRQLLAWRRLGVVQDVCLVLNKQACGLILPDELSNGEYLYLSRLALLVLLRNEEDCLFLLDDPDSFAGDLWNAALVSDVLDQEARPGRRGSEVLIATHSALILTDADRRQVYIFEPGRTSRTVVTHPGVSLLGASLSDITQVLFGLDEAVGCYSAGLVSHALDDAHWPDREAQTAEINRLLRLLGAGFSHFRLRDKLLELEQP